MDKQLIIDAICAKLEAELENYARSARAAHAEATDEQSKAENKYDTRGLEASYLARGQSRQAAEVLQALEQLRNLPLRNFAPTGAIDLGALVELGSRGEKTLYFLAPSGGGTEITLAGREIVVITPTSLLGRSLFGAKAGAVLSALPARPTVRSVA